MKKYIQPNIEIEYFVTDSKVCTFDDTSFISPYAQHISDEIDDEISY
jgi:hypothetical protein